MEEERLNSDCWNIDLNPNRRPIFDHNSRVSYDDTHGWWSTSSRRLYVGTDDFGVETDAAVHDALLQRIPHLNDGRSAQDDESFVYAHESRHSSLYHDAERRYGARSRRTGAFWSSSDISVRWYSVNSLSGSDGAATERAPTGSCCVGS